MCELLGMSANVPTDICFSFTGLMKRGGDTGPHKDGWGIAFFEHGGLREFRDYRPAFESEVAKLIQKYPIKSKSVVCHIRQANVGNICLENTHPFSRELHGRFWTYAHNGQIHNYSFHVEDGFQPVGTTDSEGMFCSLLNQLKHQFHSKIVYEEELWITIHEFCQAQMKEGVFNMLLSQGEYLICYCSTNLHWITRRSPFERASLSDADVSVDFKAVTNDSDIVTVVATQPLTENEAWTKMESGELRVFKDGITHWYDVVEA